jgi:hypothetical protein
MFNDFTLRTLTFRGLQLDGGVESVYGLITLVDLLKQLVQGSLIDDFGGPDFWDTSDVGQTTGQGRSQGKQPRR